MLTECSYYHLSRVMGSQTSPSFQYLYLAAVDCRTQIQSSPAHTLCAGSMNTLVQLSLRSISPGGSIEVLSISHFLPGGTNTVVFIPVSRAFITVTCFLSSAAHLDIAGLGCLA